MERPRKRGVSTILCLLLLTGLPLSAHAQRYLINNPCISGTVNLVSPNPVTNKEFTKTLGRVLKRPTILPMPSFAVRLLFGEMGDALLLSSARVYPSKLIQSGYEFKHPSLETALRRILS